MKIHEILKEGTKEKPVSRYELTLRTGIADRQIRLIIGELRDSGVRVCGTSNENGYWIAHTEAEYKEFRRNYMAKAKTILDRVKAMDNGAIEGQVSIDDDV